MNAMGTMGNDLVREARKRAGLSQRELADKAGTSQSAIARLESGRNRPAFDDVLRLVRLCGMDLDVTMGERDSADWMQAQQLRKLSPEDRMKRMVGWGHQVRRMFRDAEASRGRGQQSA
jgi:transcriptional regulator with XRE-family HTH domain